MILLVDDLRDARRSAYMTGIYVRALLGTQWGSFDIGTLQLASLKEWLRSRGGKNVWAEKTVATLLAWTPEEIHAVWGDES